MNWQFIEKTILIFNPVTVQNCQIGFRLGSKYFVCVKVAPTIKWEQGEWHDMHKIFWNPSFKCWNILI